MCFFVLFHYCCSHARVLGKTLVHEFPISYSHAEWYLLFSRNDMIEIVEESPVKKITLIITVYRQTMLKTDTTILFFSWNCRVMMSCVCHLISHSKYKCHSCHWSEKFVTFFIQVAVFKNALFSNSVCSFIERIIKLIYTCCFRCTIHIPRFLRLWILFFTVIKCA